MGAENILSPNGLEPALSSRCHYCQMVRCQVAGVNAVMKWWASALRRAKSSDEMNNLRYGSSQIILLLMCV
jgi:NADH:ubiquinone oxidoreductase subunit E